MEIYTINLEKATMKKWREESAIKNEKERKEWWNDVMPFEVYETGHEDIEMAEGLEGGYND
jgi:hypothetical protein